MSALLPPLLHNRQFMASHDDMDTEDRLVIDSRSTPPTPAIGVLSSDTDKHSPQSQPMATSSLTSYWTADKEACSPPQLRGGSFDALLQKYGSGNAVDSERGGAVLSMDLQLLQQCVEKSLTAAQKAPSLASIGATHELRNPALAFHRQPPMPVNSADIALVLPTDGQKTFTCQICSNFTGSYSDLQRHITGHLEQSEDSVSGMETGAQMGANSDDLVSASPPAPSSQGHSKSSSTKVFRCRQCSFVAPTKTDYWIHGRIHMRQDRMLQCPRCPFITEYKHHLEYHLRNHLGSKPFKCSTCNYACVNKSMLNSHMKSHTNVYQYRCADCSYASKYCHSLKVHLEKSNHRPASMLNPDGSLPDADAASMVTGTADLSSQMPIRRRKNGASATPISYANVPLAVSQSSAAFAMAGQSAVQGAWSSRQSSGEAPPPLVPIVNLAASVGAPGVHGELACTYCPFTTSHYVLLQQHLAVSHLGPVAMRPFPFGVASLQDPSAMRPYAHLPTGDFSRTIVPGTGSFVPENSSSPDLSPRKRSYSFIEARSTASGQQAYEPAAYNDMQGYDEERRRSYSFAVNRPSLARPVAYSEQCWSSVHELKPASEAAGAMLDQTGDLHSQARSSPDSEKVSLLSKAAAVPGELPLDLSGATTGATSPRLAMESEATKTLKDSHLEEYLDVANSHLPPRKRCRKGKAYKLDMTSVTDDVNDLNKSSPSDVTTPPAVTAGDLHLVPRSPTVDDLDLRGMNETHRSSPLPLDKKPAIMTMADTYTVVERRVSFDAESVEGGSYGSVGSPPRSLPESLDGGARTVSEGRASQGAVHECRHCDMAFGDYFMYMMHKGYHGYQDPFTCNICGERTNNKLDFFLHIARVAHA